MTWEKTYWFEAGKKNENKKIKFFNYGIIIYYIVKVLISLKYGY